MATNILGYNGENQRLTWAIQRWWKDKGMEDHYWNNNPFLSWLRAKKRVITGGLGYQLVIPLKYPAPGGPRMQGISDPYVPRSHTAARGITRSKWETAELMMPVSVPIRETRLAGSNTKRLDVVETWLEVASDNWEADFADMVFAGEDNVGSAGLEDQIASILTLVNKGYSSTTAVTKPSIHAAQSTQNTDSNGWVAGTHGATPAYQAGMTVANVVTSVGSIQRNGAGGGYFCAPVFTPATASTLGRDLINKLISASKRKKDRMTTAFCTPGIWDGIVAIIQAQQHMTPSKMTDYGFQAFSWMGIDFVSEDNMPNGISGAGTGQILGINDKGILYYCDADEPDFEEGPVDTERPLRSWRMLTYGQLTARMLGRGLGARHANIAIP